MVLGVVLAIIEGQEWLILAVVGILLFGSARLPKFARSLGEAKREFEKGIREGQADDEPEQASPPSAEAATPADDDDPAAG